MTDDELRKLAEATIANEKWLTDDEGRRVTLRHAMGDDPDPAPELARAVLRLLDEREREAGDRFLSWRGVEVACEKCGGAGNRAYANTTTWRHGSGGQSMTTDVCDVCWGTGDAHRKGVDLRAMRRLAKDEP